MSVIEIAEGLQIQNAGESIAWIIDVANWSSAPTSPLVNGVIDRSTNRDVEATVMPSGSASVDGTLIQLPLLTALTPGHTYNVFVQFTDGDETKEAKLVVRCEKRDE
jgi:hypothetical protein